MRGAEFLSVRVTRRSAMEETVDKSNLASRPPFLAVLYPPVSAAAATRSETAKPALITFREIKKRKIEDTL